jgi:hypothetical protein
MHEAARPEGYNRIRRFFFCPRCQVTVDSRVEAGQIEVEEPWFLETLIPDRISTLQLKAIRAASASIRQTSLGTLRRTVEASATLRLGPYATSADARAAQSILQAAGFTARLA